MQARGEPARRAIGACLEEYFEDMLLLIAIG